MQALSPCKNSVVNCLLNEGILSIHSVCVVQDPVFLLSGRNASFLLQWLWHHDASVKCVHCSCVVSNQQSEGLHWFQSYCIRSGWVTHPLHTDISLWGTSTRIQSCTWWAWPFFLDVLLWIWLGYRSCFSRRIHWGTLSWVQMHSCKQVTVQVLKWLTRSIYKAFNLKQNLRSGYGELRKMTNYVSM